MDILNSKHARTTQRALEPSIQNIFSIIHHLGQQGQIQSRSKPQHDLEIEGD